MAVPTSTMDIAMNITRDTDLKINSESEKVYYSSHIGVMEVNGSEKGISSLYFVEKAQKWYAMPACLKDFIQQLDRSSKCA